MKQWMIGITALAVSVLALSVSWMSRGPKIGYAETSVLISEFSASAKARAEFEAAQKEWDKNLNLLNDSLMAAMENMKANYDKAPAAERQRLRGHLEKRNDDLQRYTNAVKRMSEEKERELMEPVIRKVNAFLDLWGRKNGYDMVLGTLTGGNILQADPDLNVTARVLKDLNAHYRDLPAAGSTGLQKRAAEKASAPGAKNSGAKR